MLYMSPKAKFRILYVAKINCTFIVKVLHFVNALKEELFLKDHSNFLNALLQSVKHGILEAKNGVRGRTYCLFLHCTTVQWHLGEVCPDPKVTE